MAEPNHHGISARLWRLPRQLLLALINATAILVIVAAILALVTIARVEHFAGNIVSTMTDAVLSKIDLPSKGVLANIRELNEEVRALHTALQDIRERENPVLQLEIARLKESLNTFRVSVDQLRSSRSILTDAVVARFGDTITQALMKLRDCPSNVGQISALPSPIRTETEDVALNPANGAHNRHGPFGPISSLGPNR
jgi:hypothetical protein